MQGKDAARGHPHSLTSRGLDLPFSRPVDVDRLRVGEINDVDLTAQQDERQQLAKMLGLPSVDSLQAVFHLTRHGSIVRVVGSVRADIVQTCVVTLEPFAARLEEAVDLRFAPQAEVEALETAAARRNGDNLLDVVDVSNLPDPIVEGCIDLGGVAAEALALGLDPYPRKLGVMFEASQAGDAPDPANASPFAVLSNLKPRT